MTVPLAVRGLFFFGIITTVSDGYYVLEIMLCLIRMNV